MGLGTTTGFALETCFPRPRMLRGGAGGARWAPWGFLSPPPVLPPLRNTPLWDGLVGRILAQPSRPGLVWPPGRAAPSHTVIFERPWH